MLGVGLVGVGFLGFGIGTIEAGRVLWPGLALALIGLTMTTVAVYQIKKRWKE